MMVTCMNETFIKVLLVEDEVINRKLVERFLKACPQPVKFVIDPVGSLSEAAEHLDSGKHDIILLDLMLPDSNGVETVQRVHAMNPHIPIVVLTGLDDEQIGLSAVRIGAMDYLIKGQLSDKILIRTIQYAIELKKKEKVILDTNYQLQITSKKLSDLKQELEKKNAALEKTQEVLEKRVEERTAELRKANDNLRSTEANLRTMIKQNADGIIIIDRKGIIRFVNDAAETLFGRKKEKLIGETFGFAIIKDETTEIEIICKRYEIVTAEMRVAEIAWEGEMVYLASLRNVTERKKAEEKLKETMKMKSEFISMASHELRTPLTAIKEGIALVVDGLAGEINAEQKELLGISKKNVDRLARLIDDVLDFQKIESGRMKFDIQPNNINEIAGDVYEMMATAATDIGVDLLLELDGSLPKAGFDNDKITQVLTNLVTNAIKFTEKGKITIKTAQTDDVIEVSVSDTGCGIKKKDLPRVFDRFEQLATGGERKTGGTGLGLAISKELIEKHNGIIWVESEFNKGSKFTFTLPNKETSVKKKY